MTYGEILLLVLMAAGLVYIVWQYFRDRADSPASSHHQAVVIVEETRLTAWGMISRIGLIFAFVFGMVMVFRSQGQTELIQFSVAFIVSTILLGLGIAMGRKRVYRVYRTGSDKLFDD